MRRALRGRFAAFSWDFSESCCIWPLVGFGGISSDLSKDEKGGNYWMMVEGIVLCRCCTWCTLYTRYNTFTIHSTVIQPNSTSTYFVLNQVIWNLYRKRSIGSLQPAIQRYCRLQGPQFSLSLSACVSVCLCFYFSIPQTKGSDHNTLSQY